MTLKKNDVICFEDHGQFKVGIIQSFACNNYRFVEYKITFYKPNGYCISSVNIDKKNIIKIGRL